MKNAYEKELKDIEERLVAVQDEKKSAAEKVDKINEHIIETKG